ncbi:hypothetical protein BST99_00455 [Aureicoccus marinus]|jgi:hypothetical protein|uniref:SusD/RagB family nutrient-binding outer membrane lipoprotein n=1 Tax=Aureicoccus marinus TaxID=754435 RepID=A0A2S7T4A1_9FLAO|nr:hypothetical protein BST99_00455 [Aureicoccus marinus]
MKKIFAYLLCSLVAGGLFYSCETTELDLTENPNRLTPSQADPNFLLNEIQENFARLVESLGETGSEVVRIENMFGRNYQNNYSPAGFDGNWESAYVGILKNIQQMNVLAEEIGLTRHIGMGQVMEAYTITLLVDYFGDVPYSEALDETNLNPAADGGAAIYAAADALLDSAITNFTNASAGNPQYDFFYGFDWSKWVLAANTLKMRLAINTGDFAGFNAIVNSGNYIQDSADDFQFQWATNDVQPDTRHPNYAASYTSSGAGGDYMSIWLMNLMQESADPRIRFYFYRQTAETPGAPGVDPNEETLGCSLTFPPNHYLAGGYAYCSLENGYWGRNHGSDEGIPPDGFLRTAHGVYPVGGNYDDSRFEGIAVGSGGAGAGITPMLLASWVDFWKAEVAMATSPAAGKQNILDGMAKSIAKVRTFLNLDPDADTSVTPLDADVNAFIASIDAAFDAADDTGKMNIMAEQFFVALRGNGHDGFNFYRRTGFPRTVEPNLEPDPGAFIRSFFYPANYANTNSNATQKTGVTDQVFWDTNPSSPSFPPAN